jgi:hypothetical protein
MILWLPWVRSSSHACPPWFSVIISLPWWKRIGARIICQCGDMSWVEILLSLISVKSVMVSHQSTVGRSARWGTSNEGEGKNHQVGLKKRRCWAFSIQWELGIWDDGYIAGQVTDTEPQRYQTCPNPLPATGKFLSDAKYVFTLEAYVNGTPVTSCDCVWQRSR